jgi:hypothetical protein
MLTIDGSKKEELRFPDMKEYQKRAIPVTAIQEQEAFPVKVSWQENELWGQPLDWRVSDDNSEWPVANDLFEATYKHLAGDKYVKVAPIHAICIEEPFTVSTLEGEATGRAGDYLAQGGAGEAWPIPKAEFEDNYRLV